MKSWGLKVKVEKALAATTRMSLFGILQPFKGLGDERLKQEKIGTNYQCETKSQQLLSRRR